MTLERSNRRFHTSLLFLILGFVAVIIFLNFRASLLENTHIAKLNVKDSEPSLEPATAPAPVPVPDCPTVSAQDAAVEAELSSAASNFKDEMYGKLVWEERKYDPPSQHILNAINDNFLEISERTLLIAVVNHGMLEYTLNWIESLKRSDISKYLVFAIDQELVNAMTEFGLADHVVLIPDEWRHVQLSGDFAKWKTTGYTPITHAKSLIVERLLYLDVTVWFSDVDIVFTSAHIYRHLMWNLKSRKEVHMVFSQETQQTSINSGFYIMRPSDISKRVMGRTIDIQDRIPKLTQQRVMNRVLSGMNQDYRSSPMLLLDFMLFPNGHIFFGSKLPTSLGYEPMMVHANYRVGDAKKTSLQQVGLWYLDD
ncbi:hypothetical protein Unana1_07490 [Umbelopsis nana]